MNLQQKRLAKYQSGFDLQCLQNRRENWHHKRGQTNRLSLDEFVKLESVEYFLEHFKITLQKYQS